MLLLNAKATDQHKKPWLTDGVSSCTPWDSMESKFKAARAYVDLMTKLTAPVQGDELHITQAETLYSILSYSDSIITSKYGAQGISESESRAFVSDVVQRACKTVEGSKTVVISYDEVVKESVSENNDNTSKAQRVAVSVFSTPRPVFF